MACKHERIKSVNCEIFCCDCGEKLPIDYMVGRERIAKQASEEKPATGKAATKRTRKKVE